MTLILNLDRWIRDQLNLVGAFIALFAVRLLLGWEYWEAGIEKYGGENWFGFIQEKFPYPFNVINVEISWYLATWFELIGSVALVIGLGTRYFSISLVILTIVAIIAVHIPVEGWETYSDMISGYAISDKGNGNYKLPLIFLVLFMPLIFLGPGKFSLDHLISQRFNRVSDQD